jgi:hypothetical protein
VGNGSIHYSIFRRRNGVLPDHGFRVPERQAFHRGFCIDYSVNSPSRFRTIKVKALLEPTLILGASLKRYKR